MVPVFLSLKFYFSSHTRTKRFFYYKYFFVTVLEKILRIQYTLLPELLSIKHWEQYSCALQLSNVDMDKAQLNVEV